jgi:hypothetical protein
VTDTPVTRKSTRKRGLVAAATAALAAPIALAAASAEARTNHVIMNRDSSHGVHAVEKHGHRGGKHHKGHAINYGRHN